MGNKSFSLTVISSTSTIKSFELFFKKKIIFEKLFYLFASSLLIFVIVNNLHIIFPLHFHCQSATHRTQNYFHFQNCFPTKTQHSDMAHTTFGTEMFNSKLVTEFEISHNATSSIKLSRP